MNETITNAAAKLRRESQGIGGYGGVPTLPLYNHLQEAVQQQEDLAAAVLQEGKTLKGCFDYVLKQVENRVLERSGKQCVCVTEAETYQIAEDYWRKSDADIKTEQAAADKAFKLAQEKKRAADEARRKEDEAKRKAKADAKKKEAKPTAEKDAPAPKAKPSKPKDDSGQLSLFGEES